MGKTTRVLTLAAIAAAAGGVAWALRDLPAQLGAVASGARAERMRRSPQYGEGKFVNPVPREVLPDGAMAAALRELVLGQQPRRPGVIPVVEAGFPAKQDGDLHVTWLGHSTGAERGCAGAVRPGVERPLLAEAWGRSGHPMPLGLEEEVDGEQWWSARCRPGVGERGWRRRTWCRWESAAHLDRWGVPPERIVELDWDETTDVAGLHFVATAARHFSGRTFSRDDTLWASWVVKGAKRRVF